MRFLNKLLRRGEERAAEPAEVPGPECPHAALVPHWNTVEEMGKPEAVTRYTCESCGASFPREEGERVQAEATERLRLEDVERQAARMEETE